MRRRMKNDLRRKLPENLLQPIPIPNGGQPQLIPSVKPAVLQLIADVEQAVFIEIQHHQLFTAEP